MSNRNYFSQRDFSGRQRPVGEHLRQNQWETALPLFHRISAGPKDPVDRRVFYLWKFSPLSALSLR